MSNSGTKIFNKDISDYTKRFYFDVVYSEDTDDTSISISAYNGNLLLSDDFTEPVKCYFIGSSQTIYYAEEKSNHNIKNLTNSVYYLGYIDNENGKVRDITETPFYVYNFSFGGNTRKHSTGSLGESHSTGGWSGSGRTDSVDTVDNTYIIGDDETTSIYPSGTVTTDTSSDTDSSYIGDSRSSQIATNDDGSSSDTSNWGILDFLRGMYDTLTGNVDYSDTSNSVVSTVDSVKDKFSFTDNIVQNANDIKDYIVNTQETHKYYITINHKYLSGEVCIIDLSWYEPYKPTVDAYICAFAYLSFIWHMFCKIPDLIGGSSISSYVSDIQAYKNTGFGRSSNIHKGGF